MRTKLMTAFISVRLWGSALAVPPNAAALPVPQAAAQDQNGITTLPVLALGHHGRPVTDLNQNELELYEGKEEQSIELLRPSPATPIEVGFLIDTSNSLRSSMHVFRDQNETDLAGESLRPGDLAFVAKFGQSVSLVCRPTTDVGEVAKGLHDAFGAQVGGTTSLYDAIYWAAGPAPKTRASRKVLIVLSDMQDNQSNHTREEATVLALRSGTVIYPIKVGNYIPRAERVATSFAEETGGVVFTVFAPDDLREALRNIRAYLDNTYSIQYRTTSPGPVPVKIRCTRKGVKIVAPDQRY